MAMEQTENGCSRTEVISLIILVISVVLLLGTGSISWGLGTFIWPKVAHTLNELNSQNEWTSVIKTYLLPDLVPLGIFVAAVVLIGKELFLRNKGVTIAVNGLAVIVCLGYLAFYTLVSVAVLFSPTMQIVSMK